MSRFRLTVVVAMTAAGWASDLAGQGADRLWGRVETSDGVVHEGFLVWNREGGSWGDVLDGSRAISRESYRIWAEATGRSTDALRRVVEVAGFRVSWNEEDPDFPRLASAGVRFGHLQELVPVGRDAAELLLRSGERVRFSGGGWDLGIDMRALVVELPGETPVEVAWDALVRVRFGPSPEAATAPDRRLRGTVTDRWGNHFTGAVVWNSQAVMESDLFTGRDARDREVKIPFAEIVRLDRTWEGTRVWRSDGGELNLAGTGDAGRGHRGVIISDPGLGRALVEWDDFESLRIQRDAELPGFDAFEGGHRLRGTVTTRAGEIHSGFILWDADETWSWEILDGNVRDVALDVEFGKIASIRRQSSRSAVVTLLDGRAFDLEDSNDVSDGNRGIFVSALGTGEEAWVLVTWDEFQEVRFEHE